MEQSKNYNRVALNNAALDNVEFGHASQGYMVDPMGRINTSVRPSELNFAEAKPVLNYSIQTGEEFALEFMRDRVNPRKPFDPFAASDPTFTTNYLELKGVLGVSHNGSESSSDISMLTAVEKEPKEFERKNSSLYEGKSNYGSVASGYNSNRTIVHEYSSSSISDGSSRKFKILCSFGGKILPRPRDGKLRYVGGETRIIRIRTDISWQEIWQKATTIYIYTHTIKYQLPGEDLDALVSISSDEDLQNMMEECNVLGDGDGSKKLRMFLFSVNDLDDADFGLARSSGDSEVHYVVAVNGMDMGLGRDTSRVASVTAASSINQHSQLILPKSSDAPETHLQSHSHQVHEHHEEAQNHLPSSTEHHTSSSTPVGDGTHSMPSPALVTQEESLSEDQPSGALGSQDMHKQEVEVNMNGDSSSNQDIEHETRSLGKDVDHFPVEEASAVIPKPERNFPLVPSKNEGHLESLQVSSPLEVINPTRDSKSNDNELLTSSSAIASTNANSQTDLIDLSYLEPPLPPQSHFYSERYPREQAELLNRLTKSDDLGSQVLITHSCSDIAQQDSTEESSKNLQNVELAPKIDHDSSAKFDNPRTSDDGTENFPNNNEATNVHSNEEEYGTDNQVPKPGDKTSSTNDNADSSLPDDTAGANHHSDPASSLPDFPWDDRFESDITANYDQGNSQPTAGTGISSRDVSWVDSSVTVSRPDRGDISIDINDRFPHDFLSDIFSRAVISENSSGVTLQKDGALSMNIANHEPKHWSFFQKLAQGEFAQKDVSLIDQDQLDFSSRLPKVEEDASEAYKLTPLLRGEISSNIIDSQNNFGDQKELPGVSEVSTTALHSDYNSSVAEGSHALQVDESAEIIRIPESEYEGGIRSLPPLELAFAEFDISSLQIIKNEDLEELRELGSGTFGTVYHGKWRGSDVAIKRIKKSCFAGRSSEQERLTLEFWREAEILSKLHHPNVVAFYGVVQDGPGGTLATVAEFMVDGSLRHVLLRKDRHLDHRKKLIIAMDAAFGMEYLHSKNIVHFDLKCDNLLVNLKDPSRPICKVADFGLSKIKRNTLVSGGVRGTLPWMAPELLNGSSSKVSEKVDIFSFGIVLWEILTGEEPYANMHYGAIIGGIVNNTLRPAIPNSCDPEWKRLMEQCWAPNPMVRPTFTEITNRLRVMAAACQTRAHIRKASS
ncbi:hypothetical protein DCAR_0417286 [Daucus carota subsp. sativus]|uniref:Protein kinase domain-containing protein n=1 Tax=Daucus carota subsp. sativus TaxID=79200 RepID=A0AAF0X1I3_DAUCS|nr:PREDICTED: dual specificity protein kinase splB-like isoform X1 [Daucus carota subsp. sativus]WOG97945.1 hypothetical protein DCAR_0417286 [Daucus carota subsp. sativus]